jgi:gluconolactonase
MPLAPIPLEALRPVGRGLERPEDVGVGRDGRVWASDRASACAEVRPDGTLRRVGRTGGAPNGITMDARGRILIANFGLSGGEPEGAGALQRLDPERGAIESVCTEVEGRRLVASNYPVVDRAGNIWCSHSTWDRERANAGERDGFVYRVTPDGRAEVVARGFWFTNGLALDPDESHLYVCQTLGRNVVRLAIRRDGSLGEPEPYGPVLGEPAVPGAAPEQRVRFGATDGCGFDQEGNLWVTLVVGNTIVAITPSGRVETIVQDPTGAVMDYPTNVAWGGPDLRDLYIGSIRKDYVLHARSPVPGAPLVHQR